MHRRHLGCVACRIRLHATAREIGLLEGTCPVCGVRLKLPPSVSELMGFRFFDLGALSELEPRKRDNVPEGPVDLGARRAAVAMGDALDAERWVDEGGSFSSTR